MKIHSLKSELILSPLCLCDSSYCEESGNTTATAGALETASSGMSMFVCTCVKQRIHHLSKSGTIHYFSLPLIRHLRVYLTPFVRIALTTAHVHVCTVQSCG